MYRFVSFIKIKAGNFDEKALQDERGSERAADMVSETHVPTAFGRFHSCYRKNGDEWGGVVSAKAAVTVASGEQGDTTWVADLNKGTLTITPKPGTNGNLNLSIDMDSNSRSVVSWAPWVLGTKFDNKEAADSITEISIKGKICSYSMYELFADFKNVTKITGIENIDTSNTITMEGMFGNDMKLENLDISHFDTSNVTDMSFMFSNCLSVDKLDVSRFDTSKVTNMNGMFQRCEKVSTLDVSHFDTSNVTDMSYMFNMYQCKEPLLSKLNVENFNTSNVTNMTAMFYNCSKLTELDVSKFNTSKVIHMQRMFGECNSLTYLNLNNFDTTAILEEIKSHIDKGDVQKYVFFNEMFPKVSNSQLRTITLGTKCATLSMVKDNVIYKYGIQYAFPRIADNDTTQYVIKQKENKYGPYNYSFKRDSTKQYETGVEVDLNKNIAKDSSYDSDFADAWIPEMAGTWIIARADEEPAQSANLNDITQNQQTSPALVQTGFGIFPPLFSLIISSTVAFMICRRRTK